MPLIQNRKSKVESYVTTDDWIVIQQKGFDSRFIVIDDNDMQETVIKKPEIFEPQPLIREYDDITVAELKDMLDDYPSGANKETLYQLYIDGQTD